MDDMLKQILKYIEERDWGQFQNPKDVAISLSLEASEVLEHFQWRSPEEIAAYIKTTKGKHDLGEELADVLYWLLLMAHLGKIDLKQAFDAKMDKNRAKYPVKQVKGHHNNKYNDPRELA